MNKFCVFCGKKPEEKTKEHVIPKWLIELTGGVNRKAFFGFDLIPDKPKIRFYSFDSFSFPACFECNNEFSDLEIKARSVIMSILKDDLISDIDINCLLDWLDKVRVGLWLGFLVLSKNGPGITPKFHIRTRLSAADRLLFIYKLSTDRVGMNFIGTDSPSFLLIPSSFALLINNYCLFNVSHFNLCDRRLGFPYAQEAYYRSLDLQIEANFVKGLGRCINPIIQRHSLPCASKFIQPIFSQYRNIAGFHNLYDNDYVHSNSIDWEKGIGKIFQELNGTTKIFPREKTNVWFPPGFYELAEFLPKISQQVYDFQIDAFTRSASLDRLSKNEKRYVRKHIESCKRANNLIVNCVKEQSRYLIGI